LTTRRCPGGGAANRDALAEGARWLSTTKTVFDGAYRHMFRTTKARDRGGSTAAPAFRQPSSPT
jgi:hypothetical protein